MIQPVIFPGKPTLIELKFRLWPIDAFLELCGKQIYLRETQHVFESTRLNQFRWMFLSESMELF